MSLRRKKPLERGGPLKRKTRLAAVNRKRKAKTFARNFGTRGEAVRQMPCLARPREWSFDDRDEGPMRQCSPGPVQACHVVARGMGGAKGDRRQLVPLCARHHEQAGERGTSKRAEFEERYGLDLHDEAERIATQLDNEGHE